MKRYMRNKTPIETLMDYSNRVDEFRQSQELFNSTKVEASYECQYIVVPWKEEDDLNLAPFLSYREAQEAGNYYYPEGYDIEDYCPEDDDRFNSQEDIRASLDPSDRVDPKEIADYADMVDPREDFDDWYGDDDRPNNWELLDRKDVLDSNGFWTEYSLYHNTATDQYVTVFGDSDLYRPEDGYYDAEFDSEAEAYEWFADYTGLDDDEDW